MKAKIILFNWSLSIFGLCVDAERSPFWAVMVGFAWFAASTLILIHADRKGTMDNLKRNFK
ncbi:hypothetical protein [Limibacterium fermenti]|uniref:hypothetical protein n=1 Tax=Limibacterium fermenti TaxID=3229863 RepID=UPI000E964542|nr:hypothetical protein [Porphyromonadaceae bacterium]